MDSQNEYQFGVGISVVVTETREETVQLWASEHIQNAWTLLISDQKQDVAAVEAGLETALDLLKRELPEA